MKRSVRRLPKIGAIVLGMTALVFAALWRSGIGSGLHHPPAAPLIRAPLPASPSGAVLRQARYCRTRALLAVERERSALEIWDLQGSGSLDWDDWRLQRLAADRTGGRRKARELARQAELLARTPQETYSAVELQVMLEHEAGHHEAEFRLAQRLLALAPGSARSRGAFRRALRCRARRALGRRPSAAAGVSSSSLPAHRASPAGRRGEDAK
jgi:hypothetical protein